jgi:hypothetical protein
MKRSANFEPRYTHLTQERLMELREKLISVIEHITFGLRIHYLLKVFILQFVTLFLTFQFSNPLTIPIGNQTVFQGSYLLISALLLGVTGIFVKDMCVRTFNPILHQWTNILLSVVLYLLISMIVVLLGFVSLIIASSGISGIGLFDIISGIFFTTVFSSLLAVGYHERMESINHPMKSNIQESFLNWQRHLSWVEYDDSAHEKKEKRVEFEKACEDLVELLRNSNTSQGKQLHSDFVDWWEKYSTHEPLGKEIIIMGQDKHEIRNEEFDEEHRSFMDLKDRITNISSSYDD